MYKFKSGQVVSVKTKNDINEIISKKDNSENLDNYTNTDVNVESNINVYDELFINASHELRTPLNIIYSAVQLLELYMKSGSNVTIDKVAANINSIKRNNFRLIKLINNILDLHKIETGLFGFNYMYVNIIDVVENIVQKVSVKTNCKNLKIIFDTDTEEKYVMMDIEIIQRVLLNLISNAIKFSNSAGTILVNVAVNNSSVDIAVTDSGIGIDESHTENIFNKYGQVDKSITRIAEGSGIGLKLSMSLIKAVGGNISVISKINKGSTFIVTLPCKSNDNIYTLYNNKTINYNSLDEMINIEFADIECVDIV